MIFDPTLYIITTEVPDMNRDHVETARLALQGGATSVQFRDKEMDQERFLEIASRLFDMCREKGVPFIINDQMETAVSLKPDGVHLGQSDTPLAKARSQLGDSSIIGISVSTVEEAVEAENAGADYLGVGPIFETPSKADALAPIGYEVIREIRKAVKTPLVAIGGINTLNVDQVILAGADGIAVIAALALAEDMARETQKLKKIVIEAKERRDGK